MNIRKDVLLTAPLASLALGAVAQSRVARLAWTWDDKLEAVNAAP
jgi:hypothetical protein